MTELNQTRIIVVGVDPGQSGGIFELKKNHCRWWTMPESELDLQFIADGTNSETFVYIEQVHSMPKQGVASSFKFGTNFGKVRQAFCKFQVEYVSPQKWQKGLDISPRKKDEGKPQFKDRLRAKAQQLFPGFSIWKESLTFQRSVCDAMLIAEYGRRHRLGMLK